jgi:predicted transcriptional regulator of viral defense system
MTVVDNSKIVMRQSAEWMVPSDDRILELLREHGNLTPQAVEDFGGPSAGHTQDRLPELAEYGLVERISRGLYRISDEGTAYLDEELDASELEPVEDVTD